MWWYRQQAVEVEKLSAEGINLFSLVNNFQQTVYYTTVPYCCAFETFMTEILVIFIAPPVNLFSLTLWPWQATDYNKSSAHQFLREIPRWLLCLSDSIVSPRFIMQYTSTMLYIVLSMQIIEEHILTGLGLLIFNEYVN